MPRTPRGAGAAPRPKSAAPAARPVRKVRVLAMEVVRRSSPEHPADGVLRRILQREPGFTRDASREVARLVFAYYRWKGWLPDEEPTEDTFSFAAELEDRFTNDPKSLSAEELSAKAVPSWVHREVDATPEWLRTLQSPPWLWIRSRRSFTSEVVRTLDDCTPSSTLSCPDAFWYQGDEDLFRTDLFQAGAFELQDLSSQWVGHVCDPRPGSTWWDACAGEGGKMLHLSDIMQNRGLIWASDRADWRLKRLKQRAARAQAFNYRSAPWSGGAKLPTKTKFDGVLLDAPCSGVGTWQRNPHARWTTREQDVNELSKVQLELLVNASKSLKPGGRLVYSVCTLTRSETTQVAVEFEKRVSGFQPVPLPAIAGSKADFAHHQWIWPQHHFGNGMFIACWQRES